MPPLYTLALETMWGYMLVGGRLFGLMIFFPGLSSHNVPYKTRLLLVASASLAFTPIIFPTPPQLPPFPWQVNASLFQEIMLGLGASLFLKTFFTSLDIAGSLLGFQMSLSNIFLANVESRNQSAFMAVFFNLMAVTILFSTNLHYVIFHLFIMSYNSLGNGLLSSSVSQGFSEIFMDIFSSSFILGLTLGGPIIIISILLYMVGGFLNRLIPQMQVFFLIQPLQLLLGFSLLLLGLPIMLEFLMDKFSYLLEMAGEGA